jgi:hypothetical protein
MRQDELMSGQIAVLGCYDATALDLCPLGAPTPVLNGACASHEPPTGWK